MKFSLVALASSIAVAAAGTPINIILHLSLDWYVCPLRSGKDIIATITTQACKFVLEDDNSISFPGLAGNYYLNFQATGLNQVTLELGQSQALSFSGHSILGAVFSMCDTNPRFGVPVYASGFAVKNCEPVTLDISFITSSSSTTSSSTTSSTSSLRSLTPHEEYCRQKKNVQFF